MDRFKMPVFSAVILKQDNQICLHKRSLGAKLHGGFYAISGGGVDGQETINQATIREAREELGIELNPADITLAHVLHVRASNGDEYINFFMQASRWHGTPKIMEADKCSEVAWFDLDKLPENIMPMHKHVIDMIKKGIVYSQYGWE
ncbi:MAG TPA: NUDIX domain-containing protein [Candidatus Dependentiae bacterium]|nr:NUDIX domain-containing protein [Candidatus Dependentiae bacterium]